MSVLNEAPQTLHHVTKKTRMEETRIFGHLVERSVRSLAKRKMRTLVNGSKRSDGTAEMKRNEMTFMFVALHTFWPPKGKASIKELVSSPPHALLLEASRTYSYCWSSKPWSSFGPN